MRSINSKYASVLFCLCFSLSWGCPLGAQAVLRGTISDAVEDKPIAGVTVTVVQGINEPRKTITSAKGNYSVDGLTRGKNTRVTFSLGGYLPHPQTEIVAISTDDNRKDVQLLQNTAASVYWGAYSQKIHTMIAGLGFDKNKSIEVYEKMWFSLANIGLPPAAQVEAARQLTTTIPEAAASSRLRAFASVTPEQLQATEENIRLAVQGQAELKHQNEVEPEVAASVAADSLKNHSAGDKDRFSREFSATWGKDAGHDLQVRMNHDHATKGDVQNIQAIGRIDANRSETAK